VAVGQRGHNDCTCGMLSHGASRWPKVKSLIDQVNSGAPGEIRTPDLLVRSWSVESRVFDFIN